MDQLRQFLEWRCSAAPGAAEFVLSLQESRVGLGLVVAGLLTVLAVLFRPKTIPWRARPSYVEAFLMVVGAGGVLYALMRVIFLFPTARSCGKAMTSGYPHVAYYPLPDTVAPALCLGLLSTAGLFVYWRSARSK